MENNNVNAENVNVTEGQEATQTTGTIEFSDDLFQNWLNNENAKKHLQPVLDSHFSKSLETWKSNNLDKLVNEKMAKLNPQESAEQKMIRELQEQVNNIKQEKTKQEIKAQALQESEGLPKSLVDFLITDDIQSTRYNLTLAQNEINALIQKEVEKKLGEGSIPKNTTLSNTTSITKEQFNKMTHKQRVELYNTNPNLYNSLIN
jgi:uncharacterized protein YbcC (UPF0753/DUF2309 family)